MRAGLIFGLTVLLASLSPSLLHPQETGVGAVVAGRVTEARTGRSVVGAVVRVEGTDLGALSDSSGRYRISGVPPGPQTLRVQRIGFATARLPLGVPTSGVLIRDVELAERALEMRGLNVTVDAVSRASGELGTASVIDLEAIRHQTATSLSGLLELVPGVELEPPGLGGVEQIPLRSAPTSGGSTLSGGISTSDLASFGTLIVLDGVPVSNNANLQTLGPRGQLSFTTSAGGGVDLRRIPANTIERVQVIRGIPSVRWGDLTQGAVIVDTRAGEVAPEVAGLFDSRTLEGTGLWGGSFGGPGHYGTLTLDVARSLIQPGVADDEALRVAGQLSHRLALGRSADGAGGEPSARLTLDTRLDFFRLSQDLPRDPEARPNRASRTREWGLRLVERADYRLGRESRLRFTGSFSAVQQRADVEADLVRGAQPFTDRVTEGREEGVFVLGPYLAEADVDGGPRLAYGRLELDTRLGLAGLNQRVRLGIEPKREWNGGAGRQFEIRRPLQNTFNGVRGFDRPRSYDDVGPLVTSGYYLDDRARLTLGGEAWLQAQAGLRLDLLHEGSTWLSGVRDAVLQPRANLEVSPLTWLRLRAGAGRTAKAPTLLQLFPGPQYYDVVNVNHFTEDPAERLAVITTFIEDPSNPDLGFVRSTKTELGVEVGFPGGGVSLVAFRDRLDGGIAIRPEPDFLLRERFALTDSVVGNGVKPEILTPPVGADTIPILVDRPVNGVEQTSRGLELVASLPEWELIDTRLQVTGQWVRTEQRRDAPDFGSRSAFTDFQLLEVDERASFWDPATEFGERALLTYRLVHHQPNVGLAVTATIQHNVHDEIRDEAAADTLAFAGYITRAGELVRVPPAERSDPRFQDLRVPRGGFLQPRSATPADWLMSVQVSKTLPLDGRLNFWAFNVMDNRGVFLDPGVLRRIYPPIRFGLELFLPVRSLWEG